MCGQRPALEVETEGKGAKGSLKKNLSDAKEVIEVEFVASAKSAEMSGQGPALDIDRSVAREPRALVKDGSELNCEVKDQL